MEKPSSRLGLLEPIASPGSWHVLDAASPLRYPRSVPAPLRSPRCSFLPRLAASPPCGNLPAVPAPLLPAADRVRSVSPSLQDRVRCSPSSYTILPRCPCRPIPRCVRVTAVSPAPHSPQYVSARRKKAPAPQIDQDAGKPARKRPA